MFNNTGFKKDSYTNTTQILFAVEHQVSVGVVVSKSQYVEEDGKKLVKAGTPLSGSLDDRLSPFTIAASSSGSISGTPVGVLLHDVDVTDGDANGSLLIFGFVNTNRIDEETAKFLSKQVKEAMPKITFMAC